MRGIVFSMMIVCVVCVCACVEGATYGGGSGTVGDPYLIGSAEDIIEMSGSPADWGAAFLMVADVNMVGYTFERAVIAPDEDEGAGGFQGTAFTGVFDGGGHNILNLSVGGGGYLGLFGELLMSGVICNLGLEDVDIQGTGWNVGGLVGGNWYGAISGSYSTGAVSGGGGDVGGLVGGNWYGAIISACFSTGAVTGSYKAGGLVGYNREGTISACYSTAAVTGDDQLGGLVGGNAGGTISACYAAGKVSGGFLSGGLLGDMSIPYIDMATCFWDMDTSGLRISRGGTGLRTTAMRKPETYLRAWWDFKGEITNGSEDWWTMPEGGGYPILAWQAAESVVENDEMSAAIAVEEGVRVGGSTVGATGLDLTRNGYNDFRDVWYSFGCPYTQEYTVTVVGVSATFDTTLAVFDDTQQEIIFNDDFFGGKSVVILKAKAGKEYYMRVSGEDGQTGEFTLRVSRGAVQAIQGDLNYDGTVNLTDFAIVADGWLMEM